MPSTIDIAPSAESQAATAPAGAAPEEASGEPRVENPRGIVNRRRLMTRLGEVFERLGPGPAQRGEVLAILKHELAEGRAG